jgi:hypothetical protein
MKIRIFSVRDQKVGSYMQPIFSPTVATALRSLEAAVADPNHDFSKWASDFDMYCIGEFDPETGVITPLNAPSHIGRALDFKNAQANNSVN